MPAGDYFGELALLPGGTTRAATVRARSEVSLLVLDRQNFEKLLGPLLPQLETAAKKYSGYRPNKQGVQELNLSELEHLAILGAGGFGRVTLVRYHGSTYALKQMSKGHIVDNKLVAHVHREKKVGQPYHASRPSYEYHTVQGVSTCQAACLPSCTSLADSWPHDLSSCCCCLKAMLECSSPWLVNLVATAQDDKNIYMLLEAVMGGELFAYLQVCMHT